MKLGKANTQNCNGEWLPAALEVLTLNRIDVSKFVADVRALLEFGRGKGRCILIHGESNRAKSFIFMPLLQIFDTFTCPSDNNFNWVGASKKQVVFLNDLDYSEDIMKWGPFLNLLEGAPVNISAPKNHFSEDVSWKELTPIFATAGDQITRFVGGKIDRKQTKMMFNRWTYYEFTHEFTPETIVRYDSCGLCFAQLVLDN